MHLKKVLSRWPVAGLSLACRRPVASEARVRSHISPRVIFGKLSMGYEIFFFAPSTSVSLCQYHPTNALHLSSSTYCSYQKDKRARPGNLKKTNVLSKLEEHWIENVCYFKIDAC